MNEFSFDQIICTVTRGIIKATPEERIIAAAQRWVKENIKSQVKTAIGDVTVDGNTIQNSLSHGFGRDKIDAIPAIKNVLEKGVYLGNEKDYNGATINNHYFAGKVDLDGDVKIVFCRVREAEGDSKGKRFYVHEVFTENETKKGLPFKTGSAAESSKNDGGRPLYLNILQKFLSVNKI